MGDRKRLYPTDRAVRFLVYVVFTVFVRYYRIRKVMPLEVRNLKSPYLLLSNHVGHWDPFIIGHLLPRFTHFVSSDAAFKTPVTGFFLPRLGTIPIQKNVRDTRAVRAIAGVIRQGENVGLFPEAVRTWAGTTLPIDPSIGKLVKFLNVPVIVSVSRGMNLFNPRWSKKVRRTSLEIEYRLLLEPAQIKTMEPAAIHQAIAEALQHDEVGYQRAHRHTIHSQHRAEHLNHTLFVCPSCHRIDTFICKGNDFWCTACAYSLHIDEHGFFKHKEGGQLYFDNIRDWYDWQISQLAAYVRRHLTSQNENPLFEDKQSYIYSDATGKSLQKVGRGDIRLYLDRIEMHLTGRDQPIILRLEEILTINPQVHEKLEIGYTGINYRCIGGRPGVSGLKWEVAVNVLWKEMGQWQKLSPYLEIK